MISNRLKSPNDSIYELFPQRLVKLLFRSLFLLQLFDHVFDVFFHLLRDVLGEDAQKQFFLLISLELQRQVLLYAFPPIEKRPPNVNFVCDAKEDPQDVDAD